MRPPHLALLLLYAAPATAQLTTSTKPAPQLTAVYTTTLPGPKDVPQALTTAVVTLLMPREVPHLPFDGAPVTGTAISHLGDATSTWSATAELYWTVTGNMDAPAQQATTTPPPLGPAQSRLTSILTDYTSYETDSYGPWVTHAHSTIRSTVIKTFMEVVGGATYPATIVRTGYTHVEVTQTGGPVGGETYTASGTATWRRTTTMVQVEGRPTMPVGPMPVGPVGW